MLHTDEPFCMIMILVDAFLLQDGKKDAWKWKLHCNATQRERKFILFNRYFTELFSCWLNIYTEFFLFMSVFLSMAINYNVILFFHRLTFCIFFNIFYKLSIQSFQDFKNLTKCTEHELKMKFLCHCCVLYSMQDEIYRLVFMKWH